MGLLEHRGDCCLPMVEIIPDHAVGNKDGFDLMSMLFGFLVTAP